MKPCFESASPGVAHQACFNSRIFVSNSIQKNKDSIQFRGVGIDFFCWIENAVSSQKSIDFYCNLEFPQLGGKSITFWIEMDFSSKQFKKLIHFLRFQFNLLQQALGPTKFVATLVEKIVMRGATNLLWWLWWGAQQI